MTAWRHFLANDIDSHLHIIRGGVNYNMELSSDGVRGLADVELSWTACAASPTL